MLGNPVTLTPNHIAPKFWKDRASKPRERGERKATAFPAQFSTSEEPRKKRGLGSGGSGSFAGVCRPLVINKGISGCRGLLSFVACARLVRRSCHVATGAFSAG